MFSLYGWTAVSPIKSRDGFSFNFPFVLGLINVCVCVCTCGFSTEAESKGFCLRRVISEGQPHRHLIWASDSVDGEQNGVGNVVTRTHVHAPPISVVSKFQRASSQLRTPLVPHTTAMLLEKKQVGSTVMNILTQKP